MFGAGNLHHTAEESGRRTLPPIKSASDKNFLESLGEYIKREKERLMCPDEGPDEQRYIIYSSAFDKVIEYATAYKTILTAIKKEYDEFICAIKKSERDAKLAHGKLKAMVTQPTSLMYCQRRAVQLQERIAIIQRDTAELQVELNRLQESRRDKRPSLHQKTSDSKTLRPVGQIPGLTFDESMNPVALAKHLEYLERKRANLQIKRKSQYVSVSVKADLDNTMRSTLDQRDELAVENERLQLRYKQMKFLNDSLMTWEKTGKEVTLLEFLTSTLDNIFDLKMSDTDFPGISAVVFEEDDPSKVNESELLVDYIERFIDLFEGGEYEAAAFHAAKSPHGVLRNMETMERFKAVTVYQGQGELPPLLLFFQALMISVHAGKQLPGETLSVEGVRCAMQHNYVELVTHWVTQKRLTYSEALGDVICEHGDRKPRMADTCLALAHIVYKACGMLRKAALSMCKRGMTSSTMEFIYQSKGFTADDCLFVLKGCPSLALLQALTQEYQGQPAVLSLGFACHALLNSDLEDLALQMVEKTHSSGQGTLEKVILDDTGCSAENWGEIAGRCGQKNKPLLAQEILSILLSQSGAMRLSPGIESSRLMQHVFM
ncbi:clathrin heavy chain linker domain-containing protein 1 [Coregonus clupeaformis]|uniref:Translin-associated factor X-interacting protein 1 N-terminal domain-containing protein n=1 Tax=Coregonus suidteri TaxID=861788 RepID=A0AAN8KQL1_9TELE|nr:clathrin heavy chain linker domain-containing protein 1 [Coregonus clupeaformis]